FCQQSHEAVRPRVFNDVSKGFSSNLPWEIGPSRLRQKIRRSSQPPSFSFFPPSHCVFPLVLQSRLYTYLVHLSSNDSSFIEHPNNDVRNQQSVKNPQGEKKKIVHEPTPETKWCLPEPRGKTQACFHYMNSYSWFMWLPLCRATPEARPDSSWEIS